MIFALVEETGDIDGRLSFFVGDSFDEFSVNVNVNVIAEEARVIKIRDEVSGFRVIWKCTSSGF